MTIRERWLILPLCGVLAASSFVMSGCEDAAARERTQVQAKLDGAVEQFRRAEFSRVVSELAPVTGGEPGQQAARGLLLADSNRELAMVQLAEAEEHEMELRRRRDRARANLAGLLRLEAAASALAAASTENQRAELHAQSEAFDRQIRDLNRQIAEVDGPIDERESRIEQDRREAERLRDEAEEHYRTAMSLGPADGLKSFEQATALRRQADQVEKRISLVEVELEQEFEPRRKAAALQLEHARSSQEGIQASLRELDVFDSAYKDQIAALKQSAEELRRRINDEVKAIAGASSSEIEPRYEQAVTQFERAASEASRAATQVRAEAGAARLAEARSREALGRAHWSRARGVSDHANLLASLIAAGQIVGNVEGHRAQFGAANARHGEHMELARSAYDGALNALNQAPGRVDGIEGYRTSIQNALDLLAGREVVPAPAEPEVELDFDIGDLPIDPSMMEGLAQEGGKESLLALLDQQLQEAEEAGRNMVAAGMADPEAVEKGREVMNRIFGEIRERIERGEITTIEQLQEELMKAAEEAMKAMGFGG